ncbi:retrovirus-related pol polyprotein from transposon TNT 1-94 [Tanacetum coccineum]|uniref:Retrovirus-related pol polyprotein from transposon TNT 1-94 n=1 Tax=Tanacetum coccineum TaxID=301880 RepID=A0ABQ5G3T3_9ASTR
MFIYVEGLNHNLFSVGQFCDADLEVAFRKSTCFVRDLQGNDLLTGNRGSDLYTISLQETTSSTPICFMAKASPTQAWLWHRRLSHLNFDYITLLSKKDIVTGLPKLTYVKDQLCSSCEMSKAKRSIFKSKDCSKFQRKAEFLHMELVWASFLKDKWRLLKITLQALFLNVKMTYVHISSGLVLNQMTSDHNRSELGIQDHSNEQSSSKLVPKVVPLAMLRTTAFKIRHSMRMLVKDTRSQDGINDKDNDKGSKSRSQSMKEQTYNKEQRTKKKKLKDPHELNDKNNLIDLMKECHQ